MSNKSRIAVITEILETYEGRDKFLKTLSYAAKLATLFTKSSETARKCTHFGSKMSECRVILRLMDDIPILQETISYGWGMEETHAYIRLLKILRNIVDVVASPIEHICWAGEQKLIVTSESFWDNLSTRLWFSYLGLSMLISSLTLVQTVSEIKTESKKPSRRFPERNKQLILEWRKVLNEKKRNQILTCLRLGLDLSYAISYLPSGYIRLKTWQVGLLGTLSSFISIYQTLKQFDSPSKIS